MIDCPACAKQISNDVTVCPHCGKPVAIPRSLPTEAPIQRTGGKILAVGTVLVASALIATVAGAWWGPALLFPGAAVFILGKFWS
jgi:uncharacterized membrane protein YvbJ